MPYCIQRFGDRRARVQPGKPRQWTDQHFRWPFGIADGELPPVGNTVDVENATRTNAIGSPELITVWAGPGL